MPQHRVRGTVLVVVAVLLSFLSGIRPAHAASAADGAAPGDSLYEEAGRLYATERYVEAIPLFEQVIALDPTFANAYALLGSAFLHLGDYEGAITNFEKALRLDEGIKLAYIGLITANYFTARIDDAQRWARKCMPVLSPHEKERWITFLERKFPEVGWALSSSMRGVAREG